jgi:NAD(P)-dependent dehydrogenase (short-subunit alcohol dehydrogenase family)
MDLSEPATIGAAYDAAISEAGAFDALINNAGDGIFGPLEHLPEAEVRRQFETLFFGPHALLRCALPAMRARGAGTIINVTSLAVRLPIPFMAPYNAAKAALSALSSTLAIELAGTGVRLVDLQPGDIATAFNAAVRRSDTVSGYEQGAARSWETIEREMAAAPPPELVADAIMSALARPAGRVTVGGFFQVRIATLAARLLSHRTMLWGIGRFYGLNSLRRNTSHATATSAPSSIARSE